MSAQTPGGPGQNGEQAASSEGRPGLAWVPGSASTAPLPLTGAVPPGAVPPSGGVPGAAAQAPDCQALLDALAAGGFLDGRGEDQDAMLADELAAERDGRMGAPLPPGRVAALALEHMVPGPAMAGWLSEAVPEVPRLDQNDLVAVMISARELSAWAQAIELSAVAHLSASCAAADPEAGLAEDGRPKRLCRDAVGQVSLALGMSDYGATGWAHLAIALSWRLPATGAALACGRIDLARARLITEATGVLSQDAARAVEAAVLPEAGQQTMAQLRGRLRRAVIAADPEAAERRRADAERQAAVSLYPDEDGTATLSGTRLPQVLAAAAMAKITAIARAMKAAGQAGGLDLLRAHVMLSLLLGILPVIPPPEGAPPDDPPGPLPDDPPDNPPGGPPGPVRGGPPGQPPDGPPRSGRGDRAPGTGDPDPGAPDPGAPDPAPDDLPDPRDEDAPPDDGLDDAAGPDEGPWDQTAGDDHDRDAAGPAPPWPELGAIRPGLARPAAAPGGRPPAGLLDVTVPWTTLAGLPGGGPGILGRVGPVTPVQARQLAGAAVHDPAAEWRIIVTDPAGQAIAVTRLRRRTRAGPAPGAGLVGRVTVIISRDTINQETPGKISQGTPSKISQEPGQHAAAGISPAPAGAGEAAARGGPGLDGIAITALRAGRRALDRALAQALADAEAGGCAHLDESAAYRPPPRLRDLVVARDVTCRFRTCGQPAWRADLDHTIPYGKGRTCRCNLGGRCRKHHILKQHHGWKLEQNERGEFTWTTPAGRSYVKRPDVYPL